MSFKNLISMHFISDHAHAYYKYRHLDTTKTGYDLGNPSTRSTILSPERELSPLSVSIIRALMHATFVWTCSNNESSLGHVADLVNLPVKPKPNELSEFFWKHLEKDLEAISKFLDRGEEESILILHLVLKKILTGQKIMCKFIVIFSQCTCSHDIYMYVVLQFPFFSCKLMIVYPLCI